MAINGTSGNDNLLGNSSNDTINAGAGNDVLMGMTGDDVLNGGLGDDAVLGGAGNDALQGEQGDDFLFGASGIDILDGGAGDDALQGGGGADTFKFLNDGNDVVLDFNASANDSLLIDAISGVTSISDLEITEYNGTVVITAPNNENFSITLLNTTAADVLSRLQVACLLRGTMVTTPAGDVSVESLSIGDLVVTIDGGAKPIKWIGRRAFGKAFLKGNDRINPVLIRSGALASNVPARDLYVSPEHAVFVEGVLVPAERLVNGDSIRQVATFEVVEYFHLEFQSPQVVFTNGAPTESYVDEGSRRMFANFQEYVDLYGEEVQVGAVQRRFPLVQDGPELDAIIARVSGDIVKVA